METVEALPRDSDPPGTVLGAPEIFSIVNPYGNCFLSQKLAQITFLGVGIARAG
jgi:hypothetical protein